MMDVHRTYENLSGSNMRIWGCTYMKGIETRSKRYAVCGMCTQKLSADDLLKVGELMHEYSDRNIAVFRWRCDKGHLSFTAVTIDRPRR